MTVAYPAPGQVAGVSPVHPFDLSSADRDAWRGMLGASRESAPFVDEAWVQAWCSAFRPAKPLLWCARAGDGRLIGLGALQVLTELWAGRRIRVLQSLTNVETPRYEFVAADNQGEVQQAIWRALCANSTWDVIRVEFLPQDSPTIRAGLCVAEQLGWRPLLDQTFVSPWRALPNHARAWDEGLKRKFKANLRNRERRLEAVGEVGVSVHGDAVEELAALEVFYALEASGWKAERRTAIVQRPSVRAFYDGLVERAAAGIRIAVLRVAGRPAAAQLLRLEDRRLFLLKTAYDPDFAPYAPGQLLTAQVMRYAIEQGFTVFDFLGEQMTWKQDWEPQLRAHFCLHLFAPSAYGLYAYWSRFGLRERAKRIPGVRPLVRWIRSRLGHGNRDGR